MDKFIPDMYYKSIFDINYKKLNVIIYDTTKIKSSTYKKEVLAEELRTLLL